MLKKRKHKMKRRNTEPHMQLPLTSTSSSHQVPNSAPPVGANQGHGQQYSRPPNLVDLCDSPTHATPV